MKMNCQIWRSDEIEHCVRNQMGLQTKDPYIDEDGDFTVKVWNEETKSFTGVLRLTGNDVAQSVNMPLWEVVGVDSFGADEYALMFYESR